MIYSAVLVSGVQQSDSKYMYTYINVCVYIYIYIYTHTWASQLVLVVKNLLVNAGGTGDTSLIPGLGRSLGGGNYTLLQYSFLPEFCGQRSLAGYSLRGRKESNRTD